MNPRHAIGACLIAASTAGAGCAGNGSGLDGAGRPLPPGGGGGGVLTADFDSIQQHVFTPICTACHAGGAAPQGLRLDATSSYALLVGVPSTEVPAVLRIKAGDPNNSYLVQKIEGHAAVGAQMPFGGPPLPAATIAVIRQWVSDGAARAVAAAASRAFAVEAIAPAPGARLDAAPAELVIAMTGELDATRIDATSVRLERLAADGGVAATLPLRLALAAGNAGALIVTPVATLGVGRYRLLAPGAPATGLSAIDGARLGGAAAIGGADEVLSTFEVAGQP